MFELRLFDSILAAILQGITEVLPISSSAHLIVLSIGLPINQHFIIFLHFGSFLGFFYYYKKLIYQLFKGLFAEIKAKKWGSYSNFVISSILAILPTVILGLFLSLYGYASTAIISSYVLFGIGCGLILGGIVLCVLRFRNQEKDSNLIGDILRVKKRQAFIIGLIQPLSLFAGVSRLAACFVGGAIAVLPLKTTTHFSFIISLPLLFGAWFLFLLQGKITQIFGNMQELTNVIITLVITAFFSFITLKIFIRVLQIRFLFFLGMYRVILGIIIILIGTL